MTKIEENDLKKKRYMAEYGECFILKRLDGSEEVLNPGHVKHAKEPDFICDLSEFHDLGTKSAFEKFKKEMAHRVKHDTTIAEKEKSKPGNTLKQFDVSRLVLFASESIKNHNVGIDDILDTIDVIGKVHDNGLDISRLIRGERQARSVDYMERTAKTELIKQQAEALRIKNEKNKPVESVPVVKPEFKYQVPNCAVCQWRNKIKTQDDNEIEISFSVCTAQGDDDVEKCYNNDNCKALFEVKEEQQIFTAATEERIKEILSWIDHKNIIYELSKLPPFQQVELKKEIIFHLNEFLKDATFEDLEPLNYKRGVSCGLHVSAEIIALLGKFGV